jgi:hypothetical protein
VLLVVSGEFESALEFCLVKEALAETRIWNKSKMALRIQIQIETRGNSWSMTRTSSSLQTRNWHNDGDWLGKKASKKTKAWGRSGCPG